MLSLNRQWNAFAAATLAAGTLLSVGCATPSGRIDQKLNEYFAKPEWVDKMPFVGKDDQPPKPYPGPVKLAMTWTPDVLVQSGKTPTRGFGGRLFFFNEKSIGVPVEGTLTIHGFETGTDGSDALIRPFKFTPEQFTQHYSQSDFGASYSIWVPWDALGGDEKRISLVATFETTQGRVVQGSPTTVILPGDKPALDGTAESLAFSPQYEDHRQALAHNVTRSSGMVTTTIKRYSTDQNGIDSLPSPSLRERVNAIAASRRVVTKDGETPFGEVPSTPTAPTVMAASAEIPTQMDSRVDRSVRPAGHVPSAPQRIESPSRSW